MFPTAGRKRPLRRGPIRCRPRPNAPRSHTTSAAGESKHSAAAQHFIRLRGGSSRRIGEDETRQQRRFVAALLLWRCLRHYVLLVLLLLRHMSQDTGRRIEALQLSDLTAERVTRFLLHLETERHNSIVTRNARLAGLHTFARFLIANHPEHMAPLQGVLGIPFKRGAKKVPIDYLEMKEVEALLGGIDRATPSGQRDYVLFALMLNTGARVQEILNLKVEFFFFFFFYLLLVQYVLLWL